MHAYASTRMHMCMHSHACLTRWWGWSPPRTMVCPCVSMYSDMWWYYLKTQHTTSQNTHHIPALSHDYCQKHLPGIKSRIDPHIAKSLPFRSLHLIHMFIHINPQISPNHHECTSSLPDQRTPMHAGLRYLISNHICYVSAAFDCEGEKPFFCRLFGADWERDRL